jgi:hypothetical protein
MHSLRQHVGTTSPLGLGTSTSMCSMCVLGSVSGRGSGTVVCTVPTCHGQGCTLVLFSAQGAVLVRVCSSTPFHKLGVCTWTLVHEHVCRRPVVRHLQERCVGAGVFGPSSIASWGIYLQPSRVPHGTAWQLPLYHLLSAVGRSVGSVRLGWGPPAGLPCGLQVRGVASGALLQPLGAHRSPAVWCLLLSSPG